MPTALVSMPTPPVETGDRVGRACAALSDIGLTFEDHPRKNVETRNAFGLAVHLKKTRSDVRAGRNGFRGARAYRELPACRSLYVKITVGFRFDNGLVAKKFPMTMSGGRRVMAGGDRDD
jgi:hypothetical protein